MIISYRGAALTLGTSLQLFGTAHPTVAPFDTVIPRSDHVRQSHRHQSSLPRSELECVPLDITVFNNHNVELYAYVTAIDNSQNYVMLMNKGADSYEWHAKPTGSSPIPSYYTENVASYAINLPTEQDTNFSLPCYASSGRIYISEKNLRFGTTEGDPTVGFVQPSVSNPSLPEFDIRFQFIEFTYQADNFVINLSNMDFVSIPLSMSVLSSSRGNVTVPGLRSAASQEVCKALKNQRDADNYPWDELCQYDDDGEVVRVLSPTQYIAMHPGAENKLTSYYDDYVDQVWERYVEDNLAINIQDTSLGYGNGIRNETGPFVDCRVVDDVLQCSCRQGSSVTCSTTTNTPYTFSRPSTTDIFGCTQGGGSPFTVKADSASQVQAEIVPRLCAAFHRSTLLLADGNEQPNINITAKRYYSGTTTNHYARIVHDNELDGMGYAFAYDDTNPVAAGGQTLDNATANAAGVISMNEQPQWLYITVGI